MKQSLRKTPSHLSLAYKNGAGGTRLVGRQFTLLHEDDLLTLSIDLAANFQARDKAAPCYLEAVNLLHNHDKLGSLQSGDNLLRTRLIRSWQQVENPQLRMCLDLGTRGRFLYAVQPHSLFTGGIQLDVEAELEEGMRGGTPPAVQEQVITRTHS
jgi:hypothetical protein